MTALRYLGSVRKQFLQEVMEGKVILINPVIGYGVKQDSTLKETQVLADMNMIAIGGAEREEHEFKKIFLDAGFSDYRIMPVLGFMSIIEVYP